MALRRGDRSIDNGNAANACILVCGECVLDSRYPLRDAYLPLMQTDRPDTIGSPAEERLAGSCAVAERLYEAGTRPLLAGMLGDDSEAGRLEELLAQRGIAHRLQTVADDGGGLRATPRSIERHGGLFVRYTWDSGDSLDSDGRPRVVANSEPGSPETMADSHPLTAVALWDDGCSPRNADEFRRILRAAAARTLPVVAYSRSRTLEHLRGASVVLMDIDRLLAMLGAGSAAWTDELIDQACELARGHGIEYLLVNRYAGRTTLLSCRGRPTRRVVDLPPDCWSSGDLATAAMTLAAAAVREPQALADSFVRHHRELSKQIAYAGRREVGSEKTADDGLAGPNKTTRQVTASEVPALTAAARKKGKRIVFTNGCFDVLHDGHLSSISEARQHGDLLVVAVNSDESVGRIKGNGRPLNPQEERVEVLRNLAPLDVIALFHDDSPIDLIRAVRPDVLVKGGEYTVEDVVGHEYAGTVVRTGVIEGISSTRLAERYISLLERERSAGQRGRRSVRR